MTQRERSAVSLLNNWGITKKIHAWPALTPQMSDLPTQAGIWKVWLGRGSRGGATCVTRLTDAQQVILTDTHFACFWGNESYPHRWEIKHIVMRSLGCKRKRRTSCAATQASVLFHQKQHRKEELVPFPTLDLVQCNQTIQMSQNRWRQLPVFS